jgi:guanosine-3',5'-bis(diphosphate) 3'-pyrophosphohydrolase
MESWGSSHTYGSRFQGRFKDYIAMPKVQYVPILHTTVIGPKGDPFEIQIRTWEMHRIAEKGIAAHWLYKEGQQRRSTIEFEEKIAWLAPGNGLAQGNEGSQRSLWPPSRLICFEDEVFVFTPKGDVKNLPAGSTPVDFAFSVHTDVGLHCSWRKGEWPDCTPGLPAKQWRICADSYIKDAIPQPGLVGICEDF